ncbi:MAG: DUF2384 domain-containing protein [Actinomycetota bacterium]
MTTTLDRAVEVRDVVSSLRRFGLTQKDIASATGASERSIRNWAKTSAIRPTHEGRLSDLREVVLILQDSLTARGVGQWLRARNRLLDGQTPIELLAHGKVDLVRAAAASFVDGAYV